jgi:hypothetical protein
MAPKYVNINGFELPPSLEADLEPERRELAESEIDCLRTLLVHVEKPIPALYGLRGILLANRLWTSMHVADYLGSPSKVYRPGDIDPRLTLIFGHAEPDSPIALDYRTQPPRVLYLGDVERKSYWLELAATYEAFTVKLSK